MRTLILLLILVNCAGAKDAPRAKLVATPTPVVPSFQQEAWFDVIDDICWHLNAPEDQIKSWAELMKYHRTPSQMSLDWCEDMISRMTMGSDVDKIRVARKLSQITGLQVIYQPVTPIPTPPPVVVTPTPIPVPSEISTPTPYPTVVLDQNPNPTANSNAVVVGWILTLMGVWVAAVAIVSIQDRRGNPEPNPAPADPPKKRAVIYDDYGKYLIALQGWNSGLQLFEQQETARLAQLDGQVKKAGGISSLGCLGFIVAGIVSGSLLGAGVGWVTILIGTFVVGTIAKGEQQFRRRRYQHFFVRREFDQPQPVYQSRQDRQQEAPKEKPQPRTESQDRQPRKVTSLRDAFDILGIPVGSIEQARFAYRSRISEYHPDKVAHLGKELRELAALKSVEFNLAMDYISSHLPKV